MFLDFALALTFAGALHAAGPITEPGATLKVENDAGASEGPAWDGRGSLYFTGRNRIFRLDTATGSVQVFRDPSGGANGLIFDHQNRLVTCEAGNRRITRTEPGGGVTVLADAYEGHRFNSPNDLALDGKGRIYFTDPRYGRRDGMEMSVEGVYRIDAPGKVTRILSREQVGRPNGILVSPGDRYLYVADNNNNNAGAPRKLWRFRLKPDGSADAASRTLIFDWGDSRGPDGIEMDSKGRLFVAAGLNQPHPPYETNTRKGGIYVLSPNGKLLELIPVPRDEVTNCAFGGADLRTLYITVGGTLFSIRVRTPGRTP
ncbi:MAG: SMP-30/gluconolactonase/LRE family protein [Bryobacterales bacterium]|nr:SMP-30/gluconolactonase/LRE family protein [Bryobacterales bacterium]